MKIVVIVDMQNDFVDGVLGTEEAKKIVPNITSRLRELKGSLVLFTKDTHYEDYLETQEGQNLPVPHCIYMTPGWSIVKDISSLVDYSNDYLSYSGANVMKGRFLKKTFGSIELAKTLREIVNECQIDEITFMGLLTDICVISNVLITKAFCPETLITVDASCCAGLTPEKHKAALEVMESCQIKVINKGE